MAYDYKDYGYKSLDPGNGESGRRLADKIISVVQKYPDIKTICDLGCGNGYIGSRLASLGYKLTGVDASESGIDLARQNYPTDNLEFICARVDSSLQTVLQGRKFDLVLSSDVIEHLYRPADLIEVAATLLKSEGHIIIGTPYHGYLKNLALSLTNKWDSHHTVDWDGGHIKFFSVRTLRELITGGCFTDTSFTFYGRTPWLWKNMICHARKKSSL